MLKQKITLLFILAVLAPTLLLAQPAPTAAVQRFDAATKRQQLKDNSVLLNIPVRNVGPTVMGGRVVDVAVNEADPTRFFVAFASGGLWQTNNNGNSFEPLFDAQAVMTIGDIAVNWATNTVWVGTGENNSSRSSYAGVGIYKSADGGKTWQNKGLSESQHIGRIVLHPTDTNTLWVAALGHLYSPNKERGVYKSTDGGETWQQVLFVNENAGAIDLVVNPKNPNELYAAMWERTRRAWDFTESGKGSGIYKSTDGGETWTKISTTENGFPDGEGVGRIGLTMFVGADGASSSTRIYAVLDNQFRRKELLNEEKEKLLTKEKLSTMTTADFLKIDVSVLADYLEENDFPKKYSAKRVVEMVKKEEIKPSDLVDYLYDANQELFDTPVTGAEVYRSDDGGKTWTKTHKDYLENVFYSYGYYFGQIRVSPLDADKIYVLGVPILRSDDGGKTFKSIQGDNVHADHHALWCSPTRAGHLINGNDGGLNISYDDGEHWTKMNNIPVGQFYAVNVDKAKPYRIYGGLQDNGIWVGTSDYKASASWQQYGHYPYKELLGGDGMQIEVDTRDNNTIYAGYQFGNYFRIEQESGKRQAIQPKHELGEKPLRFNWQTPVRLSVHNQDILYFGANKLYRSFNQGDDFEAISGDLTKGGKKGDVAYGTLTTISESVFQFGLIYTGSDDGLIFRTKDGGNSWEKCSDALPQDLWVSGIEASTHEKSRVYAALNGYRWDDFGAYLYRSDDFGKTWQKIGGNLPNEPINCVKEDPVNADILYVGTDHGLYVSLDGGQSFMALGGLPDVSVHHFVVQREAKELVVGTHGRSIYVVNVEHLQQVSNEILEKTLFVFALDNKKHSTRWGSSWSQWATPFLPNLTIPLFVREAGTLQIEVQTQDGSTLKTFSATTKKGLNYVNYDLTVAAENVKKYEKILKKADETFESLEAAENGAFFLEAGKYQVIVKSGSETVTKKFEVTEAKR